MSPAVEPRVVKPGFHARVYAVVRQVPPGYVTTYGQVAALLGSPRVARHVGFAMAACAQTDEPVPWHRVINSRGEISDRGDPGRFNEQRELLEDEGVEFNARGRVDLKRFRYEFPNFKRPPDPAAPEKKRRARKTSR
ncbi:MAG: MGMT family protein [Myxococcota bacterium]